MGLRLSADEIRYITLFESMTGAGVKDCIIDADHVVFVVKKGDMGLAIGKKGVNIQRVRQALDKKVEVVEYSEDPVEFIKNILASLRIKKVSLQKKAERQVAVVSVDGRDRARAIGRGGRNIQMIKQLAGRHHDIADVVIA
ncbi:MAG: NusA-like transcription termination signal-binding factor [Euryarchaeota archaeon]|nr:NusA-like transcription termination signal-binding factor [Euryarchaeota archaeon]